MEFPESELDFDTPVYEAGVKIHENKYEKGLSEIRGFCSKKFSEMQELNTQGRLSRRDFS